MALTTTQRIAAIDVAIDAIYTSMSAQDGVAPLDVGYIQDPDGGQISFRNPADALKQLELLEARRDRLVEILAIESAGEDPDADGGPIILVRRRI